MLICHHAKWMQYLVILLLDINKVIAYPNLSLFTHYLWRFPSTHPGQSKQPWDLEMADDPLNTPRICFFCVGHSAKHGQTIQTYGHSKNTTLVKFKTDRSIWEVPIVLYRNQIFFGLFLVVCHLDGQQKGKTLRWCPCTFVFDDENTHQHHTSKQTCKYPILVDAMWSRECSSWESHHAFFPQPLLSKKRKLIGQQTNPGFWNLHTNALLEHNSCWTSPVLWCPITAFANSLSNFTGYPGHIHNQQRMFLDIWTWTQQQPQKTNTCFGRANWINYFTSYGKKTWEITEIWSNQHVWHHRCDSKKQYLFLSCHVSHQFTPSQWNLMWILTTNDCKQLNNSHFRAPLSPPNSDL